MTAPAAFAEEADTVVGQVAAHCDVLADVVGGCLVELPDGRLVAHRLGADVPQPVVAAVVASDTRPVHAALTRPRTTCILPLGPVVEGVLGDGGARVAHLLLGGGAGLWLLPRDDRPLDLAGVLHQLQALAGLLLHRLADGEGITPWLDGQGEVPEELRGRVLRVVRVDAPGVPTSALAREVTCGTPLRHRGGVYLVVPEGWREPRPPAGSRVVVSAPTTDLVAARRQVDAALPAVPLGTCRTVEQVRPAVVWDHLARAMAGLPDLGTDPLAVLTAYESRRGGELARTVRTWLDAGCDVVETAARMGLHGNTVRYRLNRVNELLGTDLRQDMPTRLELHLRLSST